MSVDIEMVEYGSMHGDGFLQTDFAAVETEAWPILVIERVDASFLLGC